jgi:hypothetical protein
MAGKEFISIKKAAQLTGQPEPILLKLWERYQATSRVKEKNGKRYISQTLLKKKLATYLGEARISDPVGQVQPVTNIPPADTSPALLELLTLQLHEKDKQLNAKDTQIAQLIERTREQNNIIYSLEQHQQQLESKLALHIAAPQKEDKTERPQPNYLFIALVMLLVGVILIIFYTFLNS